MPPYQKGIEARFVILVGLLVAFMVFTPIMPAFADSLPSSHPNIKIKESTSSNWSGYAVESSISSPTNGFAQSVKGNWVVPTLACSSSQNTYAAIWVGIDGYSDGTVEQTGTEQQCVNGVQQNYAWIELYPKPSQVITGITVSAGDSFTASVTYAGNSQFTLSITDSTTGKSFSNTYRVNAQRQSAEWIVEAPYSGGVLPLANFGTVSFSSAQFTDSAGTTYAVDGLGPGTYDAITMNDPSGGTATPSGLTDTAFPQGPSSFSVTYGSSATTSTPSLSVSANPATITTAQSSTITASTSNSASGIAISFSTNLGSLGAASCTTDTTGACSVTFSSTATGTATISVSASGYASASTTVTVTSTATATLSVTVSAESASYLQNSWAYITVTVTANGTPVSGASVTLTVTAPNNGGTAQGSGTTGSSGQVIFKYRIGPNAPLGTYTATAQASATGYNSGSGSTSFTVI